MGDFMKTMNLKLSVIVSFILCSSFSAFAVLEGAGGCYLAGQYGDDTTVKFCFEKGMSSRTNSAYTLVEGNGISRVGTHYKIEMTSVRGDEGRISVINQNTGAVDKSCVGTLRILSGQRGISGVRGFSISGFGENDRCVVGDFEHIEQTSKKRKFGIRH
jgi:hypothetical protein